VSEPIRVGPTHGPRCVPGCDGYGAHARSCPDSPNYDPNWLDELGEQIKRDLEQRAPAPDTPAARREPTIPGATPGLTRADWATMITDVADSYEAYCLTAEELEVEGATLITSNDLRAFAKWFAARPA
jgi:hypothetical protein